MVALPAADVMATVKTMVSAGEPVVWLVRR
jgi:hypothetical protein